MKQQKSILLIAFGAILTLSLGAFLFFSNTHPAGDGEWHVDQWRPDANDGFGTLRGTFPYFSEEDLMGTAALVIHGRAVGRSAPFFIENIYTAGRSVFTDYRFEVYEVLRGETSSREVIVRMEGGMTQEMRLVVSHTPEFEQEREYLLFLNIPGGGPFDTPGEYFYIVGGLQGVFPKDEGRRDSKLVFEQYRAQEKEFEVTEFRASIEAINETVPIRSAEELRAQGVENMRTSIEHGVFYMSEEYLYEMANAPLFPGRIVE